MTKHIATFALLLSLAAPALAANGPEADGKPHKFSLHDRQFWVDETPMRVMAGEIHPGRIPPEFWEDRIKKAKAMGLNTVSVYLFWNQVEPAEGKFAFEGQTDIRKFVKLCQDNGMWVIFRSGPYVCGEIDFGGLPAWLLKHEGLRIRANEPQFLNYCKAYVEQIAKQVADLQVAKGGPIIMTQLENEYQRIDDYLKALQKIYVDAGFDGQLMTCDPSGGPWTTMEYLPNVLRGYNGFDPLDRFEMRYTQSIAVTEKTGYPIFSPEVYTGWFAGWGPLAGKSPKVSLEVQRSRIQFLFDHKDAAGKPDLSWCLYVFDGGTNFGFSAGPSANRPVITSYDYDAPVDELGRTTPKYKMLREMYAKELGLKLPEIPADPKVIEIPEFALKADAALVNRLPAKAVEAANVTNMENLDQNHGFIDYRKEFADGIHGALTLGQGRDYIQIMVNGRVVQDRFSGVGGGRGGPGAGAGVNIDVAGPATLDILVHNLGRNSLMRDGAPERKGLLTNPSLAGAPITGWKIYSLPLDDPGQLPAAAVGDKALSGTGPTFYSGNFNVSETGETYLDMSNFHFGVVWVNGHNLGRFWEVGPPRCLYLPSVWQKKGDNQITVLELG
ncbi:MAG TPA: beta-galactosidase, partial [Phycisphaerae bacterium]|nr:beta-galactosidase [Phycisphaerae bacterium]